MQLSSIFDHPVPRSLDQSYHEYLDEHKIKVLEGDQVLTRYIARLKEKSAELVVKKASEKRAAAAAAVTFSTTRRSTAASEQHHPGGGLWDDMGNSNSSLAVAAGETFRKEDEEEEEEPNDLITVPHFYLFKLNTDTIITLYPERWDKTNEARLHNHILNAVSRKHDRMLSDDTRRSRGDMDRVAETILDSCLTFEAKAFAKCRNPHVPNDSHDVELTFSKAYANTIAEMVCHLPT